jgi:hypothetical protein
LAGGLVGGIGGHLDAACHDHAPEDIAWQVHRSGQALGQGLGGRRLTSGLDPGDEDDRLAAGPGGWLGSG